MEIRTREQAVAAGRTAVDDAPLHDLAGHMERIGVPIALRSAWLGGLEDALEERGCDTDPDSDGHGWERRALAGI